jgi:hypothetical protein
MNTLIKSIESTIQIAIEEYIKNICKKYDSVEAKDLENIWNDVSENVKVSVSFTKTKKRTPTKEKNVDEKSNADEVEISSNACPYIVQKGKNEGQICGAKLKANSTHCSRHVKYEGVEQKAKKIIPQVKKTAKKSVVEKKEKKEDVNVKSKIRISLEKNKKINMYWHKESTIVFNNIEDKNTAIGTYKDSKLCPINDDNIELCKKWNNNPYKIFTQQELDNILKEKMLESNSSSETSSIAVDMNDKVSSLSVKDKVVEKKIIEKVDSAKKSLTSSIAHTKFQAKQVEEVLEHLQFPIKNTETNEEDNEDEESEYLEEEDDE